MHGNIYVIDRQKNLSLGCRMTAHYQPTALAAAA